MTMRSQDFNALRKIIGRFSRARILVVGDLILDEFMWGTVSRISPEAPVPVVWVKRESFMPGGACNVASNLTGAGAKTSLMGVIGDDERGAILKGELESKGIDTSGIIADEMRQTTLKTRVVAHHQQVVRIDRENVEPLREHLVSKMAVLIREKLKSADALIIEDYGKGVITPRLLREVVPHAKRLKRIVAVDPKEEHFAYYRGVTVITPNVHEAAKASGVEIKNNDALFEAGGKILRKIGCRIALVTLGENGMCVFQTNAPAKHIPTIAQEVFDVSGAGDTVIAVYTLALVSGADPIQAAHLANCAAGIVVGKIGTATVNPEELVERVRLETSKAQKSKFAARPGLNIETT